MIIGKQGGVKPKLITLSLLAGGNSSTEQINTSSGVTNGTSITFSAVNSALGGGFANWADLNGLFMRAGSHQISLTSTTSSDQQIQLQTFIQAFGGSTQIHKSVTLEGNASFSGNLLTEFSPISIAGLTSTNPINVRTSWTATAGGVSFGDGYFQLWAW